MASLPGDLSYHGTHEGAYKLPQDKSEGAGRWYFSRKEIEENSPSKGDGVDLKKETYLRKSYCTFLQDLGMRLKVPQVTIATAIIFCHRFFLRQSHAKNDRRTIATVCMFLAGKVEETPRPLKDVILVSYEIIHKKDPAAVQRVKQKEVYEQQKELILLGERVVLATLGFDLNVHHPYKPLVEAIKKFKVAQNALAQVAWNFVNDGLRTSLCLQFKPHHIAAGAIFLAAKFLKVKLPSDGEKVWWQEFDVTPRQLEEVSNQMLELYEQNRVPPSQGSEVEGSTAGAAAFRTPSKSLLTNEDNAISNSSHQAGGTPSVSGNIKSLPSHSFSDQTYVDNNCGPPRTSQSQCNGAMDHYTDGGGSRDDQNPESDSLIYQQESMGEAQRLPRMESEGLGDGQESKDRRSENRETGDLKERHNGRNLEHRDGALGQSPQETLKMFGKLKAVMKERKLRGDIARKTDLMDDDDLIERELEDIEVPVDSEKVKRERKQNWSKQLSRTTEPETSPRLKHHEDGGHAYNHGTKQQPPRAADVENMEEGEVTTFNDVGHGPRSPKMNRKRKAGGSPDKLLDGKQQRLDYKSGSHQHSNHEFLDDRNRSGRLYSERDHKRHVQENHI